MPRICFLHADGSGTLQEVVLKSEVLQTVNHGFNGSSL